VDLFLAVGEHVARIGESRVKVKKGKVPQRLQWVTEFEV